MRLSRFAALIAASSILLGTDTPGPRTPPKATGWTKSFYYGGKNIYPEFTRVMERSNGELLAVGASTNIHSHSYDDYDLEGVLLVASPAGTPRSFRMIGSGGSDEYLKGAIFTTDGGYLLYGCTFQGKQSTTRGWVAKLNASWKVLWQKSFGRSGARFSALSAYEMQGGGFIVLTEDDATVGETYVLKFSSKGAVQWQKKIPLSGALPAFGVSACWDSFQTPTPAANKSIRLFGFYATALGGYPSVLSLDGNGKVAWAKYYQTDDGTLFLAAHPRSLTATADGGAVAAFMTNEFTPSYALVWAPYALKIGATGQPSWIVRINYESGKDDISLWGGYPAANDGATLFLWEDIYSDDSIDSLISVGSSGALRFARSWEYANIPSSKPHVYAPTREGGQVGGGGSVWKWDKSGRLSSECKLSDMTRTTSCPGVTGLDVSPLPSLETSSLPVVPMKMTIRKISLTGMTVRSNCRVKALKTEDDKTE